MPPGERSPYLLNTGIVPGTPKHFPCCHLHTKPLIDTHRAQIMGSGVVWSISYSTHFIFTITLWGTSHYHPCFIEEETETHHWPINSLPFDNIICHSHYNNVLKTLAGWPLLVLPFLCLSFLLCKRGLESYLLHRVACGGNEFIRVSLLIQCLRQNQYFLLLYFFFILLPLKTRPLQ